MRPIDLQRRDFDRYYNGYANSTLWPVCHYLLRGFRYSEEQHEAYERVNRQMAQRLLPLLQSEDLVWVHDYHLIPLAERLRELGATQPVGFFLHIPFPHIEMLRILPTYAELLRELVAYDVVGFQTENDLRAFLSGVEYVWGRDVIGADGRITIGSRSLAVGVFPIGVDVAAIEIQAAEASQSEAVSRMTASLQGRKLMIGVDRLDYSKGLIERFAAYQQFSRDLPGESRQDHLHADRAAGRDGRARLRGDPPDARAVGRPHQRPFRGCGLDADPLSQPQHSAQRADGLPARRAGGAGHAGARRDESGRQGIRRGAGSVGPRGADSLAARGRGARAQRCDPGEPVRHQAVSRMPSRPRSPCRSPNVASATPR